VSHLKQLIREIHRRSLWQVLLVYIGGALVGYQAIQALTEGLGLPGWFPAMAIVLFIVGLPIVLATSFVQEGFSSAGQDPTLLPESGIPVASEVVGAKRLFTWRNAILGGALAFGVWGVGVTGWLLIAGKEDGVIAQATEKRTSIAVLPFTDMSPGGDQAYFGDGVAEEILNALARIEGLRVAARTSAFKLRDEDVATVGERLNVSTVLEGSVRKQGDRVRVTAQLINVEDGFHLWSNTFERQLDDIFAVQDEISRSIAGALQIELTGEDVATISRRGTVDIEAYNRYLRGRYYWNQRTAEGLEQAIEEFRASIAIDPIYALAYSGLADAYSIQSGWAYKPAAEVMPQAKAAALRALELDENLAAGHLSLAFVLSNYDWDWQNAEAHYLEALRLDPNNGFARYWYSMMLDELGRNDEAERQVLQARQLDPLAPQIGAGVGTHFIGKGDYERAIDELLKLKELTPDFVGGQFHLARAYLFAGEYERALAEIARYEDRLPGRAELFKAQALWLLGRRDEAQRSAAAALAYADTAYLDPALIAQMYAGLGRMDEAFNFLDEAIEARSTSLFHIPSEPYIDWLGDDPRYSAQLRRMGLER
jgi:serine/threonine-protein kinase